MYLNAGGAEQDLATTFLRWFMPQILFYGLGATIGAILNVRRSFAAPMFAPVLNNLLVIAVCAAFILLLDPRPPTVGSITGTQTTLLAVGTTAGVVVMTLALIPSLRKVGFRYRPRLNLRDPRLLTAARLAGWTFLF
nr:lipid II flippase MurJ [Micromonospora sp. DSM 115978]